MAKYYMTLALLLCLALENNNIYARSHPSSSETASLPLMRTHTHPHPRHQPHQHVQHTSQQLQQHHTRQHRDRQPKHIAPDPTSEEAEPTANQQQHYYQRLTRHLRRQRQHMLQQERSYHRVTNEELKNSPKLWQLLSQGHFYDEPESETNMDTETVTETETKTDELDFSQMLSDAPAEMQEDELLPGFDEQEYIRNELESSLAEPAPPEIIEEAVSASVLNITNSPSNITKVASGGCPKCESNRQVEHITEEELRRLRIEFVKQQILEKLRLKESPNVSALELPRPIFEGVTLTQTDESSKNKDYDDYYARTNQKFILMQREEIECRRLGVHPSMCFSFKIDDADADGFDVSSAVLWLYKNKRNYTSADNESPSSGTQKKQTIVVSEVEQQLDSKYLPLAKTIAIQSVDVQGLLPHSEYN
ncbi:probable serine/threonine-protein kinase DDB_G0280133 isoform X3 [Drosophila innubila]|uniref:probable serine/threonine-protein kinase DDB_G0280133 isoform X3 n=1 Tax=Drosophila innubila TaxID=198719 RepID=UPI00148D727F|nr:probable serine/threonine-protein kinase DDB_G0280133 isoform X3 [Drosophila innubila]